MPTVNSAAIFKSIEPVNRHFFGLEMRKVPPIFSQIFETTSTEDPILDVQEYGGPGAMTYKPEGDMITGDTIVQGVNKRFAAQTFATAVEITQEALEDTRNEDIKRSLKSLGRAARMTPEYLAAQFLDRAFDTNYPALGDQLPLCSASHTIPKGGTYSNLLATPYSFSEFALEQIFQNLAIMPDTDGFITPLSAVKVVVPVGLGIAGWKLNSTQNQVGSANNDLSYVAGKFDPIVFNFLSSNTRYFVTTDAEDGLFWRWRIKPTTFRDNVDRQTVAVFMARFRAYWGCINGRGIFGVNAV